MKQLVQQYSIYLKLSLGVKCLHCDKETEKKIITAKPISESNSINKPSSKDKVRVKKLPVRKEVEISEPLKHD